MLAKTGLALALGIGLIAAGVLGVPPANAQMDNEERITHQPARGSSAGVLINEVEANPPGRDAGKEWIELYNPTSSDIDISNFSIQTLFRPFTITVPSGAIIEAGQFYVVRIEGERLSNIVERLTLLDASGKIVDMTPSLPDGRDDARTWQRIPDGSNKWRFTAGTPGEPNDPETYQNAVNRSTAAMPSTAQGTVPAPSCLGSALCIEGKVIRIANTDTLYVRAGQDIYKVDLSLTKVSRNDAAYGEGFDMTRRLCLGSDVLVDQDDGQVRGRGNNITATVYCSSYNLNQTLLDSGFVGLDYRQCFVSEFAGQDWAKRHGCI